MKKVVAVITGDLVHSSDLPDEKKDLIREKLKEYLSEESFILPLQFYRGDSFQVICNKEKAAWLALLIEATIISVAETVARISIGIGTVSNLHQTDVLQSEGEAFTLSGQNLDTMKSESRILKISSNDETIQAHLAIVFRLVENIVTDWKRGQASVMSLNLQTEKQKDIAERLKISPAAVSKTLKSAKWIFVEEFLAWYHEIIKKFDA